MNRLAGVRAKQKVTANIPDSHGHEKSPGTFRAFFMAVLLADSLREANNLAGNLVEGRIKLRGIGGINIRAGRLGYIVSVHP